MLRAAIALAAGLLALAATAQRTTRPGRVRTAVPVAERVATPPADTLAAPPGAIVLSGYDKTLAATRESFFVTNTLDSATVVWLAATIDYLDTAGRQLHRRRATMRCAIPAGQTRRIDIPSWDRQHVYYYRASEPRRRVQAAASPFDVAIKVDSIAIATESPQ